MNGLASTHLLKVWYNGHALRIADGHSRVGLTLMTTDLTFGQWLKRRRSGLGFTQAELGRRVGYAAVTIRKIEADEMRPSRQAAEKLAEELNIPPEDRAAFIRFARDEGELPDLPTHTVSSIPAPAAPVLSPSAALPPGGRAAVEFPSQVTLDAPRHNLPVPPTPLIGREQEQATLEGWLAGETVRLVTLTGPGGVGKTRLAVQVAADVLDHFADGVYFVHLAPIDDPALVASTIARTLSIPEAGGRPLTESLADFVRNKRLLLALDNFEQVVEAAPVVADLLQVAPQLKVLVTSREVLRVRGEHAFTVPPLPAPAETKDPGPQTEDPDAQSWVFSYPAVQLFVARAQAAQADFVLTQENAPAVAAICARLDGLPLAIELAAARSRLLSPQAMLARLEPVLKFLTGGARDLPARQQTLRATLDWSYGLLDEAEKTVFRRLAVFVGGCTLEAAETVCHADGPLPDVLASLGSLVDKSLLRQYEGVAGEARFRRLRVIREYALERLVESGEAEMIGRQHAHFFLTLAEAVEPELMGANQAASLDRLEMEYDNLRAAVDWYQASGDIEGGLRLAMALHRFWEMRVHLREGYHQLDKLLHSPAQPTTRRAGALRMAGRLAFGVGNYMAARTHFQESLALARELGDKQSIAAALNNLGLVAEYGLNDYLEAHVLYEESLAIRRELGNKRGIAAVLNNLANVADYEGNYSRARTLHKESLILGRELGDLRNIAISLNNLGVLARNEAQYAEARSYFEESLSLRRKLNDQPGIASSLNNLALVVCHQGEYAHARALCQESLLIGREIADRRSMAYSLYYLGLVACREGDYTVGGLRLGESLAMRRELGDRQGIGHCLAGLAGLAAALAQPERAGRLMGASTALLEAIGTRVPPADWAIYDSSLASAHLTLGEDRFAAAEAEGGAMPLEEAVTYALNGVTREV